MGASVVAYLVNQYPKVSHSFIRREILALEEAGAQVVRVSVRPVTVQSLADPTDLEELKKTVFLLQQPARMAFSALRWMALRPKAAFAAAKLALAAGRRTPRKTLIHFVYLLEAAYLCQLLRVRNVTHLHAHFGTNPAAVAMLARVLGGPPYSITIHGSDEFDAARSMSLDLKIRHSEFVAGISEFTLSQISRWIDQSDRPKLHLVRCGLDKSFLNGNGSVGTPETTHLLFVGRLTVTKGIFILMDALRLLKDKGVDCHLDIVGDGELRADLEESIIDLKLHDTVILHGAKSSDEVHEHLHRSRALVLPSFAEGLPVVLMEAYAAGRVSIASWVAGVPELIEPKTNGWLVTPGSVESLAKAMEEVLATPTKTLDEMASRGRQSVLLRHNAQTEATRLMTLFGSGAVQ
jgi:colanic acid/amylovoran biosynthesis glycosyltransferase